MFLEEMNQLSAQKRISNGNAADIFNRTTDERFVQEWQLDFVNASTLKITTISLLSPYLLHR
jgi:hypothetical protein